MCLKSFCHVLVCHTTEPKEPICYSTEFRAWVRPDTSKQGTNMRKRSHDNRVNTCVKVSFSTWRQAWTQEFCGLQVHFHSFCRPRYVLDLSQWDTIISTPAQKQRLACEMCVRHANYSMKWITAWSRKSMRSLTSLFTSVFIQRLCCIYVYVCVFIYSHIPKQWGVTKTMLCHCLWRLTMQTS